MVKESRKEQILTCACSLFADQGYDATSLAQIAKACGCSASLIIRHFGSKDNLYLALQERFESACEKKYIDEIPDGSVVEKLHWVYDTIVNEVPAVTEEYADLYSALRSRSGTESLRAAACPRTVLYLGNGCGGQSVGSISDYRR